MSPHSLPSGSQRSRYKTPIIRRSLGDFPDCADGGAREITWDLGSLARVTSYEYGNPPDLLEALVEVLTGMEQEIRTCAFGTWFSSIPDCEPVPGTEPG